MAVSNVFSIQRCRLKGCLVAIEEAEGIVGHPEYAANCTGKGAIRNLTKSAALHAGRSGYKIRVNRARGRRTLPVINPPNGFDYEISTSKAAGYRQIAGRQHRVTHERAAMDTLF